MSDYNKYDEERERRLRLKRLKQKRLRRRRRIAILILVMMALAAIGIVFGAVKLVMYLFADSSDDYVNVSMSNSEKNIILVDNTASDEAVKIGESGESQTQEDNKDGSGMDYSELLNNATYVEPGSKGLVIIDAGHGGYDGGTGSGEILEKNINLEIAYWLKEELEFRGYSIYMTRTDDTFVGLNERASLANATDSPLALVSIHQNSIEGYPEVCGIEAWTYDRSGCNELAEALSRNVSLETGAENRGVNHKTNLVVTSKTTMPAVIIECGYMSNPNELTLLQTENYQLKIAAGIANAVDEFVEDYYGE